MPQQQEITLPMVFAERLLFVPDYQRPYSWGTKQIDDLWEDLDLLGPSGTHYAGTLVLRALVGTDDKPVTSDDDDGVRLQHFEVVDGQQRLTTCLILLDRVRRRLESLADVGVADAAGIARRPCHLRDGKCGACGPASVTPRY